MVSSSRQHHSLAYPRARGHISEPSRLLFLSLVVALCLGLGGCAGGGNSANTSTPSSPNPAPAITSLSPSSVTAGAAAQTLTINGTNFLSTSTATYNGVAHTATFANSTQLTISLSTGDEATAGTDAVVVANPSPGGGPSNSVNFVVKVPAAPTVTISANLTKVFVGQPLTLTWSSANATSCTASGAWSGSAAVSGTQTVAPSAAGSLTYTLACAGSGGNTSASTTVTVATPSLSLTNTFSRNATTISTSEGAPYGDCDFWVNGPSNCWNSTQFGYGPTKVMRLYICLSGEVSVNSCTAQPTPTGPLPSSMLADIDSRLGAFGGTGMRLLLRFDYNMGPSGSLSGADVPASLISSDIDQLAPIVLKYRDLIFALQAGFIGQWGEWHDSTSGNVAAGPEKTVLDKEASYFAGVFPILVRYPGALIQYTGNLTPPVNFGLHDDGFASDPQPDPDTNPCRQELGYCLNQYTQQQLVSYKTAVATNTMFVAEPWQVNSTDQSCSMLDILSYGTPLQSFTLLPYPLSIGSNLVSQGCATSFFNKVGTRIELQNATIIGNPTANGNLYVAVTLVNTGYGHVIRQRPVTLVLISNGSIVAQMPIPLGGMDLRQLASSSTPVPQTFQFNITLPSTFPSSGSISSALLIPDPAPSLTSEPPYALPLNSLDQNNNPVFNPGTGFNMIATFNAN